MTSPYIDGAAISPNFANDGMAFGGTYKGLDRTKNRGVSWELMPGPGTIAYPRGLALSPNFAQDGIVYLGTTAPNSGGIAQIGKTPAGFYTSTDQGKTWTLTGLNGTGVISIAISPAFTTDNTVFVATESNGVYKSTDSASTWTQLKVGTTQMVQVVLSPGFATDGTVFTTAVPGRPLQVEQRRIELDSAPQYWKHARSGHRALAEFRQRPDYVYRHDTEWRDDVDEWRRGVLDRDIVPRCLRRRGRHLSEFRERSYPARRGLPRFV